jgi:uncharacterized protein (UPF0261 family)/ABC-type branched-subunit amino acid transport system ATPase component
MAEAARRAAEQPVLEIEDLHVFYGRAHALQGVALRLERGVLGVVGRNGMGKTTLCNAVMGLVPAARGSIRLNGIEMLGLPPNEIVSHGVGYVPQGRRVWPSLSVDEHLRVAAGGGSRGRWTIERIYETFRHLRERRRSGGAQLSGGEQQMLAISRALLANPLLLVMDEPTEGLAPIIVEQVSVMLRQLADEGEISVLLIEQNLGVATAVAERVAIMVNGRIARETTARELASDHDLQQRLLGVRSSGGESSEAGPAPAEDVVEENYVLRVRRAESEPPMPPVYVAARAPTFWSSDPAIAAREPAAPVAAIAAEPEHALPLSVAAAAGKAAYVAGTFDTKQRELLFIRNALTQRGLRTITVDLGTSRRPSPADVSPREVARHHPHGAEAVFVGDRGRAVAAMAEAFERFIATRRDLGGLIAAGGSGATALATPAMRRLPVGIPKVMVSTVASGDVRRYVGPSDICMLHSVTDVQGINRISEQVLANAAHALAGMIAYARAPSADSKPAVGLTMFGLTTPCVQAVTKALEQRFDCIVFHATGTGGQSLEKLIDSGLLAGVIDVTTTEIADLLMGGVMSAGEDRLGAVIRTRVPYVGSVGALDMVNFRQMDSVPAHYRGRRLHAHNPEVTLMRTTAGRTRAWDAGSASASTAARGRCVFSSRRRASRVSIRQASRSTTRLPMPPCSRRSPTRSGRAKSGGSSACPPTSTMPPSPMRWSRTSSKSSRPRVKKIETRSSRRTRRGRAAARDRRAQQQVRSS